VDGNQAVPKVTLLVPKEGPLDTGGKIVPDAIDIERDKKEQALADKRQSETGHGW
jgi:hypothetical protein